MAVVQASFLRERRYLAVGLVHFFVDVLNSSRNLVVALLAVNIGLTNSQIGIALIIYNIGSALSQPLFGSLADRFGPRSLVVWGIGWMILFGAISAVAGDWLALIAITIMGIGSGAFHPSGTIVASRISHTHKNRATALFFMVGQMGLFIGPILGGIALQQLGRPGYLALPALAFLAFASGWQWLTNEPHSHDAHPPAKKEDEIKTSAVAKPVRQASFPIGRSLHLSLVIICYSTLGITAMTFVPVLFTELDFNIDYIGRLAGIFMLGSAVGNVFGGALADRFKGRWVIILAFLLAVLPLYLFVTTDGLLRFLFLLLAGFFSGMPHSILVITVQKLLPNREGMASGMVLGMMFFGGSIGSYLFGLLADQVGLIMALQSLAFLPILGAAATFLLPRFGDT